MFENTTGQSNRLMFSKQRSRTKRKAMVHKIIHRKLKLSNANPTIKRD